MSQEIKSSGLTQTLQRANIPDGGLRIGICDIKRGFGGQSDAANSRENEGVREIFVRQMEPVRIVLDDYGIQGSTFRGWEGEDAVQRRLPVGSSLDGQTGVFSWIPTPGFLGTYCLNFIAENGSGRSPMVRVRLTVVPRH